MSVSAKVFLNYEGINKIHSGFTQCHLPSGTRHPSLYNSRQTGHKDLHELNKDTGDTAATTWSWSRAPGNGCSSHWPCFSDLPLTKGFPWACSSSTLHESFSFSFSKSRTRCMCGSSEKNHRIPPRMTSTLRLDAVTDGFQPVSWNSEHPCSLPLCIQLFFLTVSLSDSQ